MKREITVMVRREDKLIAEDGVLWVDELPPEYQRGGNRRMKSRQHKRERMERIREQKDVRH